MKIIINSFNSCVSLALFIEILKFQVFLQKIIFIPNSSLKNIPWENNFFFLFNFSFTLVLIEAVDTSVVQENCSNVIINSTIVVISERCCCRCGGSQVEWKYCRG